MTAGEPTEEPPAEPPPQPDVRLVAFYLPQYHPIPENDAAWGKGFTEWTNVARAKPLFPGHHQPHLPAELGFYDLRLPEVMEQQAAIAREHGIHAFCHYFYWFDGRRLLERPLEAMLASGRPDMPFCLCWANESWTRRWDGAESEVIVEQSYTPGCFDRLVVDLLPYLEDRRYLRVDDRPLLLIYRPGSIPGIADALAAMRRMASDHGIDLSIAAVLGFGYTDAPRDGFDFAVEFPPLTLTAADITASVPWTEPFQGGAYDYEALLTLHLCQPEPPFPTFRTAMVGFDNTARRGADASIFLGATPERFESWLAALVARARLTERPNRRLVFINAWNEWGEGNHLEPDQKFGRNWLRACARAVGGPGMEGGSGVGRMPLERAREAMQELERRIDGEDGLLRHAVEIMQALDEHLRAAEAATGYLGRYHADWLRHVGGLDPRRPVPASELGQPARLRRGSVHGHIEYPIATTMPHRIGDPLIVRGWIVDDDPHPDGPPRCLVALVPTRTSEEEPLLVIADHGMQRRDVGEALFGSSTQPAERSGFAVRVDVIDLAPGAYQVRVGLATADGTAYLAQTIQCELA
ncbi:hypothetical protein STAQ_16130 [Allostella sp. ATCC 35155]|nr:hypothetical protein STAQ_16130 [Stella sp. ATCC 35155]